MKLKEQLALAGALMLVCASLPRFAGTVVALRPVDVAPPPSVTVVGWHTPRYPQPLHGQLPSHH